MICGLFLLNQHWLPKTQPMRLLNSVEGNVTKSSHHHKWQFGQTDADDEQQRTAQKNERGPGQE